MALHDIDDTYVNNDTSKAEKDHFPSLCRVCMSRSMNMICLFTAEAARTIEELEYCTGVLMKKEDGLPTKMCELCLSSLATAHKFKTTCLRSDYIFHNVIKKQNLAKDTTSIKIEAEEEIEENYQYEELETKQEIDVDDDDDDEIYNGIDDVSSDEYFNTTIGTTLKAKKKKKINNTTITRKLQKSKNVWIKKKNNAEQTLKPKEKESEKEVSLNCTFCDLTFANQEDQKEHKKTVHINNSKWICEICGKSFKHRSTHYSHIRSHLPPTKQCDQCDYKTSHKADLDKHLRIHKGVKDFACEYCPKRFFTSSNLCGHIKRHHGQRSRDFVCPRCGRAFCYLDKLRRHMDAHDNVKRFECEECHDRFSRRCQWKIHLKKMHNISIPRMRPGRRKINVIIGVKDPPTDSTNVQEK